MSIFLKNIDWSQNQSEIFINVRLNGKKSLDDVIISGKFLKITHNPFYYEVFFEHPICVEESSCKILESNIKFCLKKKTEEWWLRLGRTAQPAGNDVITEEEKQRILYEYERSVKDEIETKKKTQAIFKRNEIDKEIERANEIRKKIDETESALENSQISKIGDPKSMRCSTSKESEIVPIRRCGKISVSLSSREFVTPKRESLENAEREWCAKQHDIMVNRLGLCDDDLNSNERDLPWLLRKGHEFLTKENYLGAVSAYSFGLKISKDLPDLFLGRARAQYALRNYERCAEDCSDALERLRPACESNRLSRIHCFWLRGKSLIALGLTNHGEGEIQMANKLDPHNFGANQERFSSDI